MNCKELTSCYSSIRSLSCVRVHTSSYLSRGKISSKNPSVGQIYFQFARRNIHQYHLASEEYSVVKADCFQHYFKKWQDLRRNRLTASTFAGAIGFWRGRRIKLWLEKLGVVVPFEGNLATCWSNSNEEKALEQYKVITRNSILLPEFQVYGKRNPEDSWLGASPDGLVETNVHELPSGGVLEIKCPFFGGDMTIAAPWKRIPLHYIPQAQGLLEITDRDWMDLYCWTQNGSSLFRVYRDVEYWAILREALSDFWWKHIQPAKELCKIYPITDPCAQLSSHRPEPRHPLCSVIVYRSKHIVDNSKLLMREIHGEIQYW